MALTTFFRLNLRVTSQTVLMFLVKSPIPYLASLRTTAWMPADRMCDTCWDGGRGGGGFKKHKTRVLIITLEKLHLASIVDEK